MPDAKGKGTVEHAEAASSSLGQSTPAPGSAAAHAQRRCVTSAPGSGCEPAGPDTLAAERRPPVARWVAPALVYTPPSAACPVQHSLQMSIVLWLVATRMGGWQCLDS